ncbi:hypothetical protein BOSEA31B_20569 [Hyphomicrobiales bacterium]|nr:hypothetical protein BOSEA31B_20569 [Hyphomicrobiales bacterium]CAH1702940.1 hypothetical protein BOSEA1005_30812 [Hyphomicrobiales bacterium]CAI0347125.1 hypothetical protein BO1005MUT1_530301 [Hyphomicrobiales bacterium]
MMSTSNRHITCEACNDTGYRTVHFSCGTPWRTDCDQCVAGRLARARRARPVRSGATAKRSSPLMQVAPFAEHVRNALRREPSIVRILEAHDKAVIAGCVEAALTGRVVGQRSA